MRIHPIRPELLAGVWPLAAPMLAPAVARAAPLYALDDMPELVARRVFDLWLASVDGRPRAAALVRIGTYPRARVVDVAFLGGQGMRDWIGALDEALCAWGRHNGATAMMGGGRRGWCRLLGFREWNPVLLKEI